MCVTGEGWVVGIKKKCSQIINCPALLFVLLLLLIHYPTHLNSPFNQTLWPFPLFPLFPLFLSCLAFFCLFVRGSGCWYCLGSGLLLEPTSMPRVRGKGRHVRLQKRVETETLNARNTKVVWVLAIVVALLACLFAVFHLQKVDQSSVSDANSSSDTSVTTEALEHGVWNVSCSPDTFNPSVEGCATPQCARLVIDDFISDNEAAQLIALAELGMSVGGGGSGPPSILDLTSGAVSAGNKFVDVYHAMKLRQISFPKI